MYQRKGFVILLLCFCVACGLSNLTPTPITPGPGEPVTATPDGAPTVGDATATETPLPPTSTSETPGTGTGLPDLTINASVSMDGYTGECVTAYASLITEICVENRGIGDAGAFNVTAADKGFWPVPGVAAGAAYCFKIGDNLAAVALTADSDQTVAESDESNNTWMAAIPTPPLLCTPGSETAPETTPASSELAIVSFTSDPPVDLPDGGKRITFHWQTTGATTVQLSSNTHLRFPLFWTDLDLNGDFTYDFPYSLYPNPTMMLTAYSNEGQVASKGIAVNWPCHPAYFFTPVPKICPMYEATLTDAAEERFEHGAMIWMKQLNLGESTTGGVIFLLYDNGSFERLSNTWTEGMPESDPNLQAPQGLLQPIRGFGKLWRENAEVRESLGWAVTAEVGYAGAWQPENNESNPSGTAYVRKADGQVLRLYNGWEAGTWKIWDGEE